MILAFIGGIGSGKTLSMVRFMHEKYKCGRHIFTNFGIKFKGPENVTMLDMAFFSNYQKSGFNVIDSVVAIDEAHVFIDSRNAMSRKNKLFSKFVTQSRKRSVDLIYTTQDKNPDMFLHSGQVELRLRKLTDYIIFCQCLHKGSQVYIINSYCDSYGIKLKKSVFLGNDYFDCYDTNEIIDIE